MLVIGSIASGKKTFVRSLGYTLDDFSEEPADGHRVLIGVEGLVGSDAVDDELLGLLLKKDVIICTEVGSGVVPIEARQRVWRENVGRLEIGLAEQASCVVRMVCGIPQVLKGDPWSS